MCSSVAIGVIGRGLTCPMVDNARYYSIAVDENLAGGRNYYYYYYYYRSTSGSDLRRIPEFFADRTQRFTTSRKLLI